MRPMLNRVVEVLYDRGEDHQPVQERWSAGTGCLIGGDRVVTAAHVLDHGGGGAISVRTVEGGEYPATAVRVAGPDDRLDLAVIRVSDPDFIESLPDVRFARIDREDPHPVRGCWAMGFPVFQDSPFQFADSSSRRQTHQVWGYILPGTKLRGGHELELLTHTDPQGFRHFESGWQGISGAPVLVNTEDGAPLLIGVITQHNAPAGAGALTLTPISAVRNAPDAACWWKALGEHVLGDMEVSANAWRRGERPDRFRQSVAQAARRVADTVEQIWRSAPARGTTEQWGLDAEGDVPLPQALTLRAQELCAAPPEEDRNDGVGSGFHVIAGSPQLMTIIDQLVARHLLGQYSSAAEELLEHAFFRLCDVHGVTVGPAERGEAFRSLAGCTARTVRNLAMTDQTLVEYWQRSMLYSLDSIRGQLSSLGDHLTEHRSPESVGRFLDELRVHLRKANSRISLTMLGQNRSLSIDDIYVEPTLELARSATSVQHVGGFGTTDSDPTGPWEEFPGTATAAARRRSGRDPRSLTHLDSRRAVILGRPGVGKSTLATKVAFDASRAGETGRPLAFVVTLRDLMAQRKRSGQSTSLIDHIAHVAKNDLQMAQASVGILRYLILGGDLHIIFDGLDEVIESSEYEWVVKAIEGFCVEYKAAPVTVTSRSHGFDRDRFADFEVRELSPFSDNQVSSYVRRWFDLDNTLSADRKSTFVRSFLEQSAVASDLRSVPLLLALMCSIFVIEGNIPSSRSEIYEKCAQLYFRDWDARREIIVSERISKLPSSVIFEAFSSLAAFILGHAVYSGSGITEIQLKELLQDFFEKKEILQPGEEREAAEAFAVFVMGRAWLVDKVGRDEGQRVLYQFTHRTFLEYFAAEHYFRHFANPRDLAEHAMTAFEGDGQIVIAELAFQICARKRSAEVDRAVTFLIDLAVFIPLSRQAVAANFLTTLLGEIPLTRHTVHAIVSFCVRCVARLAEVARQCWGANGYSDQESTDWFEYRSLCQASGFTFVDDLGEMLGRLVRCETASHAVLRDAVRTSVVRLVKEQPEIGALLACSITEPLRNGDHGPPVDKTSELFNVWRAVEEAAWKEEESLAAAAARRAPSLACCAVKAGNATVSEAVEWHGVAVLYRRPLNPFCETSWTLAQILVQNMLRPSLEHGMPSEGDLRALRQLFEVADRDLIRRPEMVVWRSQDHLDRPRRALEEAESAPPVGHEEQAAAVVLLMLDEVLKDSHEPLMVDDFGPHVEAYQDFLRTWRTAESSDLAMTLREKGIPDNCVDVLVKQAGWLRDVDADGLLKQRLSRDKSHWIDRALNGVLAWPDSDPLHERLGRETGDAVDMARQRVASFSRLAESAPDAYRPSLAVVLAVLRTELVGAGHVDEGIQVQAELVELLSQRGPFYSRKDHAVAVGDLADALARAGRPEESVTAARSAVELLRFQVLEGNGITASPATREHTTRDLAVGLARLALCLERHGRFSEAVWPAQERVQLLTTLHLERPRAFTAELDAALVDLVRLAKRARQLRTAWHANRNLGELRATWNGAGDGR